MSLYMLRWCTSVHCQLWLTIERGANNQFRTAFNLITIRQSVQYQAINCMSQMNFVENKREIIAKGKWMTMKEIHYVDPKNTARVWETIERTTKVGDYDAVEIFGVIRKLGEADQLLLVLQYRPPVGKLTLELPAGLIDQGETPAEAALRELKEETGYVGQIVKISPPLVIEPGLTNASSGLVHVTIDADLVENQHPKQELDETEFIEVLRVPLHNLLAHLTDLATTRQCLIDAKLYTLALGLSFTSQ